jgi:hypothetical protein
MSLSDLASLGSFVSGVAVLISLIFLYVQLRQIGAQIVQAEKNQKAAIGQGRTNRIVELVLRTAEPGLGEAVANVFSNADALTAQQLFQFLNYTRALLLNAEDTFYQHANGLLEDEPYQGFVNAMRMTTASPATRLMWPTIRPTFGPSFARFVDQLIEEAPPAPPVVPAHQLALWKAGIAAMTAAQ